MLEVTGRTQTMILVIDDDKDIAQTIKGNLELDGYEVLCAFDGLLGLDLARRYRPNLVVLDLNLPDIDGIKRNHGQDRSEQMKNFKLCVQKCGYNSGQKAGSKCHYQGDERSNAVRDCHGRHRSTKGEAPIHG